jgi:hypothetical protein
MPWSGSSNATFSRTNGVNNGATAWTQDKNAGTKITSSRHDAHDQDLAGGINATLKKDGTNAATDNLNLGGNRYTNAADGTARDDLASVAQVQDSATIFVDGGGTADAITAVYAPAITNLADGLTLYVRATAANATTTPTFAPNGLTAHTIVKNGAEALVAGNIAGDGHILQLQYELANTRWQLLNPVEVLGDAAQENVASGGTGDLLRVDGDGSALTGLIWGQCRLDYTNSTTITLSPYGGNTLTIDGATETVPSAGVTLANTGLTAATLYYIYAYMDTGTMTLEASATGHTTHTNGVEIKTGDSTRTLVGMVYMAAGTPGTFADSATQRFVASWFNRKAVSGLGQFAASRSVPSTSFTEINTEIRVELVTWGPVRAVISGYGSINNGGPSAVTAVSIDGTPKLAGATVYTSGSAGYFYPIYATHTDEETEGYHFVTLEGFTTGNTATWTVGPNAITSLHVELEI